MKKHKKKVAFCFSGQARTLEYCFPYIKQYLLDPLGKNGKDYDVFCCVVDDTDAHKVDMFKPTAVLKVQSKDYNKKFQQVFKEQYRKFFTTGIMNNNANQLRGIFLANKLRKDYQEQHNIEYEWVFKFRYDLFPLHPLDYKKLNKKAINVPGTARRDRKGRLHKQECNDILAIGTPEQLDIYSDQINNYPNIVKSFYLKKPGILLSTSLFFERLTIHSLETLSKWFSFNKPVSGFFKKLLIARGYVFKRPELKKWYTVEAGLYRHLKKNNIKTSIFDIDYALVRKGGNTSILYAQNMMPHVN